MLMSARPEADEHVIEAEARNSTAEKNIENARVGSRSRSHPSGSPAALGGCSSELTPTPSGAGPVPG